MKWNEFLDDPELNTDMRYHHLPDGEYLFVKVYHDVLECLTAYKGYMKIAKRMKDDNTSSIMFECLNRWNVVAEEWASQITLLVKKDVGKYPTYSPEWAKLIATIGTIVNKAPTFRAETEALILPDNDKVRQVIDPAIKQSKKLELIWMDIQNEEYKRLLTIIRYGELV